MDKEEVETWEVILALFILAAAIFCLVRCACGAVCCFVEWVFFYQKTQFIPTFMCIFTLSCCRGFHQLAASPKKAAASDAEAQQQQQQQPPSYAKLMEDEAASEIWTRRQLQCQGKLDQAQSSAKLCFSTKQNTYNIHTVEISVSYCVWHWGSRSNRVKHRKFITSFDSLSGTNVGKILYDLSNVSWQTIFFLQAFKGSIFLNDSSVISWKIKNKNTFSKIFQLPWNQLDKALPNTKRKQFDFFGQLGCCCRYNFGARYPGASQ